MRGKRGLGKPKIDTRLAGEILLGLGLGQATNKMRTGTLNKEELLELLQIKPVYRI